MEILKPEQERDLTPNNILEIINTVKGLLDKHNFVRLESMEQIGKDITDENIVELFKKSIIIYYDESNFDIMNDLSKMDEMFEQIEKLDVNKPEFFYYILPENKMLYDSIQKVFKQYVNKMEEGIADSKKRYNKITMSKFIKDEKSLNELLLKYGIKRIEKYDDFNVYDIDVVDEKCMPKITVDHNVIIITDNHKFNETYLIDMVINLLMIGFEFKPNTEILYVTDFETRVKIIAPKHAEIIAACDSEEKICNFEREKLTSRILIVKPEEFEILCLSENYLEPINFGSVISCFIDSDIMKTIPQEFENFLKKSETEE